LTLVERPHRRLLDVIKEEFDRRGRTDINPVQALMVYNIGDQQLCASELRTRGFYLGTNITYNLKKLVQPRLSGTATLAHRSTNGAHQADPVCAIVEALCLKQVCTVEQVRGVNADELAMLNKLLHRLAALRRERHAAAVKQRR
jgi:hypothetical protein